MDDRNEAFEAALAALSLKRQAFVRAYLVSRNGTQAAIAAGFAAGSAHVTASRMLRDDKVRAALAAVERPATAEALITRERVLLELARLAFADIRKLAGLGAGTLALTELDDDTAAALAEVVFTDDGVKAKLSPKLPALERLGRHLGLFRDREEDRAADAAAVIAILEAARTRAKVADGE